MTAARTFDVSRILRTLTVAGLLQVAATNMNQE
jgi:hypothetical protein